MESMKNIRYQVPKIIALSVLLALVGWTYFSFIAGPVNKVLVQRDQAIDALMSKSAFASCAFLTDSQLDVFALILECQSQNAERLVLAIDLNGKILTRFRSEKADDEIVRVSLNTRYPESKSVMWAYYGNDIIYRLISDTQEIYLDRKDFSVLMKVRLDHE